MFGFKTRALKREFLTAQEPALKLREEFDARLKYTPDMTKLMTLSKYQLIFIYNETQYMAHMHRVIRAYGQEISYAFTRRTFTLWKKDLAKASQAIALTSKFTQVPYCRIKGELYLFPTEAIPELDTYQENTVQFTRQREYVYIPFRQRFKGPDGTEYISEVPQLWIQPVWMYVGDHSFWYPQLDAGYNFKPVRTFSHPHQALDPYYCFTLMDCRE